MQMFFFNSFQCFPSEYFQSDETPPCKTQRLAVPGRTPLRQTHPPQTDRLVRDDGCFQAGFPPGSVPSTHPSLHSSSPQVRLIKTASLQVSVHLQTDSIGGPAMMSSPRPLLAPPTRASVDFLQDARLFAAFHSAVC